MNAAHPLHQQVPGAMPHVGNESPEDDNVSLLELWDIIVDHRWLVIGSTCLALAVGGAYGLLARPVYESNLLIQVEDSQVSAKSLLGEAASLFDVKTAATAEMEILRSRMVVSRAVDKTLAYISAKPVRIPLIGDWLARNASDLSDPMFFGWSSGREQIHIAKFDVPARAENESFSVVSLGEGRFELRHSALEQPLRGSVGNGINGSIYGEPFTLEISLLSARSGARFEVVRHSRLQTIEELQERLKLMERGRQSGVIDVALQDTDRERLPLVLNAIGSEYIRQNVERKSAEAQKMLSFLDVQLPQFKRQLEAAEDAYSRYRNKQGAVALDEEAKLMLRQAVDLQAKLVEAQQRRREMISRFTSEHPNVRTLDSQIAAWSAEIRNLNSRIQSLPTVQQDALRHERDLKVTNELYQQLRNNTLQLQLLREGKIGTARLIDTATPPEKPIKPRNGIVLSVAAVLGLVLGALGALLKNAHFRGLRSAHEIESKTGLNVYSTIPLSRRQVELHRRALAKTEGLHVLADEVPDDPAVESLRSLRTAIQFVMLETSNNRVLVTGATPGVGKSFVSVNFAAVLASSGKRVLLIDADLRRGHLNQYFGLARSPGLSDLVAGAAAQEAVIHRQVLKNLDVISTGTLPPNPSEMLMSRVFAQLLDQLSQEYDAILIDTAPVLAAADTLSVSSLAGTRLLVARDGQTQLGELVESVRRLQHAGVAVTGVLFNAVDLTRRHRGSYTYKYGGYKDQHYTYS